MSRVSGEQGKTKTLYASPQTQGSKAIVTHTQIYSAKYATRKLSQHNEYLNADLQCVKIGLNQDVTINFAVHPCGLESHIVFRKSMFGPINRHSYPIDR